MGCKKQIENDSLNKKVIEEIAEELNLPKSKVKYAVQHFFGWQREAFDELKYSSYLWNHFGTFSIIPKRYKDYSEKKARQLARKQSKKQNKTKLKNNNNG